MPKRILLLIIFTICVSSSAAWCALGDIINSFAVPGDDPRGLAWDGTNLWNADAFDQKIYKLDPSTGAVLGSFSSAGPIPVGLTFVGPNLWNIDTAATNFYSVNPTVGPPWTFEFSKMPASYMGLTYDGTHLWASDNGPNLIAKMDLSGNVLGTFPSPASDPVGMAWDGTHLWVTDVGTNKVYEIDPTTGAVIASFNSPGTQSQGLTFDGSHLWLSDTMTGKIYELDIGATPAPPGIVTMLTMLSGLGCWAGIGKWRERKTAARNAA